MAQPWMNRILAGLEVDLTSVDINSNYATQSKSRSKLKIPGTPKEKCLPSTQASNNTHYDEAATPLNLCSPPRHSFELITLSNVSQKSPRMQCYLDWLCNCFINYFTNTVPDGAVIYAGAVLFQYNEQEGMYTEFLGNPTGNVFIAASRDHEFSLSHKDNVSHVLKNSDESAKSNFV